MAIEDGAVLTRALTVSPSIPDALQLYQRNRMDRTARIVNQSNFNRNLFHLRSQAEIRAPSRNATKVEIAMSGCIRTILWRCRYIERELRRSR